MRLSTCFRPGPVISTVEVGGELDIATGPRLSEGVEFLLRAREARLVLDLAGVTFIDCAGLSALLAIRRVARSLGGSVSVVEASPCVRRLVRLTGLEHVLGVVRPGPAPVVMKVMA